MEPMESMEPMEQQQDQEELWQPLPVRVTMKERLQQLWKGWVLPFGIEILALLFVIKFLFFFVVVPSGSMIPTIDSASVLFATRVHFSNLKGKKRKLSACAPHTV